MEFVIAVAIGLFWLMVYCVRDVKGLAGAVHDGKYDTLMKEIEANEDEEFAAKRKLQSPQRRMEYLGDIQDELDFIFQDGWYQFIEPHTYWDKIGDNKSAAAYREFKHVCYHLMLAKEGKVMRFANGMIREHSVCGRPADESFELIKRIAFCIEKLFKQKNPTHAYDIEMFVYSSMGRSFVVSRYDMEHYKIRNAKRLTYDLSN